MLVGHPEGIRLPTGAHTSLCCRSSPVVRSMERAGARYYLGGMARKPKEEALKLTGSMDDVLRALMRPKKAVATKGKVVKRKPAKPKK